jgi:hypothetical protein
MFEVKKMDDAKTEPHVYLKCWWAEDGRYYIEDIFGMITFGALPDEAMENYKIMVINKYEKPSSV